MSEVFDVYEFLDGRIGVNSVSQGGRGQQLVCDCPFCGKRGKLYVNRGHGAFICYSCGEKGSKLDLVAGVDAVSRNAARERILGASHPKPTLSAGEELEQFIADERAEKKGVEFEGLPEEYVPVWDEAARTWNIPEYLRKRRIRLRTASRYQLGYCLSGRYAGRLVFPVTVFGELKSLTARAMGDFNPPYLTPAVPGKSKLLYGLDQVLCAPRLVIVEGPIDVLSLVQRGIPAVGLMGKRGTLGQIDLLRQAGCREVILMLDPDASRSADAIEFALLLKRALGSALVAHLPPGLDPDDAPTDVIERALSAARPPSARDYIS